MGLAAGRAMLSKPLLLTVTLLTSACSSTSASLGPTGDGGKTPRAPDAEAPHDGGVDAPAYATCTDAEAPPALSCGTLAWAASPIKARPRNHHLTSIVQTKAGPFLYGIAGANVNGVFANVDRALIQPDGSLGAWVSEAPTPVAAGGSVGGAVSSVLVFAGGNTGIAITDKSYSAVVGDDGTVGPWKAGGSIQHPRMHGGSFVVGDTMYILGGFQDPNVWSDAVKATVEPDGTIAAWAPAGQLPGPRSHFSVVQVGEYVYLAGGLAKSAFQDPPALSDVFRGRIGSDGTLGEWTAMPALPAPLATHASFVYGGYVYIVGGIILRGTLSDADTNVVWRAPIQADHSLGAWGTMKPLPIARGHVHQLPMFENFVYSVAGAIDFNLDSTTEIDIGSFK